MGDNSRHFFHRSARIAGRRRKNSRLMTQISYETRVAPASTKPCHCPQGRAAPRDMVTRIDVSVNMKASWAHPESAESSAISLPISHAVDPRRFGLVVPDARQTRKRRRRRREILQAIEQGPHRLVIPDGLGNVKLVLRGLVVVMIDTDVMGLILMSRYPVGGHRHRLRRRSFLSPIRTTRQAAEPGRGIIQPSVYSAKIHSSLFRVGTGESGLGGQPLRTFLAQTRLNLSCGTCLAGVVSGPLLPKIRTYEARTMDRSHEEISI